MHGEKLHYAKQAASHLIDLLNIKDRLAVVMYDTEINVVSPSRKMSDANKDIVKGEIQRIISRGSTNLFAGWVKGCEQVAERMSGNSFNRALLLSDGLANTGVTNIDEIASHARHLSDREVSTSCFGIGMDYNEHLLEAMSNAGGGNFHFLEAMSAIPLAFEREFEELINISLTNAEVILDCPNGVGVEPSAGWPCTKNDQVFLADIGNLLSGQAQKIYFQLHFPVITKEKKVSLPIKLSAKTTGGKTVKIEKSLEFSIVDATAEAETASDPKLMKRFALVDMADKATEALKLARAGKRAAASDLLAQRMSRHQSSMSDVTRKKYNYMTQEISVGMSEYSFKRHHQEEYMTKRVRMDQRDYRLRFVNGHLFTTIENQQVLIDSGIPISLGAPPEWYFMQEVHTLSQDYMGVTLAQIAPLVGTPIDILMGSDILKKYSVLFELQRERVSFSTQPLLRTQFKFPLSLLMGVPGFTVDISGKPQDVYLDTCAKLSYISSGLTKGLNPTGTEKDFYPVMGEFETKVYKIDFSLGDLSFTLHCGILPSTLESTLLVSGKKGIIGSEFFIKYRVQLDIPRKTMFISK